MTDHHSVLSRFFHEWTWPLTRWVLFHCMSCERAHHSGMWGIWIVGKIDEVWCFARDVLLVAALAGLMLLHLALPQLFRWEIPQEEWLL